MMPDLDRITAGSEQVRPPIFKVGLDERSARDVILHGKQEN
jgi:hypothetical protein